MQLDADFVVSADFRVVQLTPPGSEYSIIFGNEVTSAAPGSIQSLHLVVFDIEAARLAALKLFAVARQYLGSLDNVTRIVRLGVSVATSGDVGDQPKVADAASELLQDVFGEDKTHAAPYMAS